MNALNRLPYLLPTTNLKNTKYILADVLNNRVSIHTCDAEDLHISGGQCNHDCLGIIHSTVNIDQQLFRHVGQKPDKTLHTQSEESSLVQDLVQR